MQSPYSPDLIRPDFSDRNDISIEDLIRVDEPALIREFAGLDSDGVRFFVFSVGGWLDGENVATREGGCTVGGDMIVITADTQAAADEMASLGLQDTIDAIRAEKVIEASALDALARMETVGLAERLRLAMRAPTQRNEAFEADSALVRTLEINTGVEQ
jgi:hypothetical protein